MKNIKQIYVLSKSFIKSAILSKQLEEGAQDELEHTSDPEEAKEIAKDHLKKNDHYYSDLKIMEDKHNFGDLELNKDKVINDENDEKPVSYMAFSNLKNCIANASELLALMNEQDDLPAWADEMVALSNHNLTKVLGYVRSMKSENK